MRRMLELERLYRRSWKRSSQSSTSIHQLSASTMALESWPNAAKVHAMGSSDVVIAGAGIIGLSIANRFLRQTNLSVTVVEAAHKICAGATGAGQGYIWSGHLNPDSKTWDFSRRSIQLWHEFVAEIQASGVDPLEKIGWRDTGSLLFTTGGEESLALHNRLHKVAAAGVQVEFWNSHTAQTAEPALVLGPEGAAAFFPADCQIDARAAVEFIQQENRALGPGGRYKEVFGSPVTGFLWSPADRYMQGLQTLNGDLHSKRAVIVAAGAWSSDLLEILSKRFDLDLTPSIRPRKGHLLVVDKTAGLHLNYGTMEFAYTSTKNSKETLDEFGVATTATVDPAGNVLLGSSREFKGFDITPDEAVIQQILHRAAKFFPALASVPLSSIHPRTGLRPYTPGGVPLIGPIVELPGLFLASGHEGSGLSLALGTAEMIVDTIMERSSSAIFQWSV
ncbi:opine oxidase subunit B isoform X2 [Selaginella moellendorffii]|uniref:opine oxidase subunit B isoform X2 n=1 Tax=Selaginella moellendorffii TaxID=88036 RepID=UPI000D1D0A3B|nr:opine oxidase subunit B isoform X2 [Selaginella moellendorffii]|eukprot:XP_024525330.1 opine oxidase subunit B isoform X2 [Selaginella moellendorffii]